MIALYKARCMNRLYESEGRGWFGQQNVPMLKNNAVKQDAKRNFQKEIAL